MAVEFGFNCYMGFNLAISRMILPPSKLQKILEDPKIEKQILNNEGEFLYQHNQIV